jgi:integrase
MRAIELPSLHEDKPLDELSFFERHEVAKLAAAACPGDYQTLDRTLYIVAAYTGLRQGERRGLRWG